MPLSERAQIRAAALTAAIETHLIVGGLREQCGVAREESVAAAEIAIRKTADAYAAFIEGTARLRLTAGPVTDQSTGVPTGTTITEGADMAQLHDTEKFTVTADTEDAKGFDTAETIEWTLDVPEVATLTVSDDTKSVEVAAGSPGSAVLTANLPALGLSATLAIDVVPGGTATIDLAVGDVTEQ
jgi:hypothetical protein